MDTEKPRAKKGMKCPLWQKDMSTVCHTCEWWVQLRGKNPQTHKDIDHWGCAISWLPILMIENTQQARQAGASTDKVANEIAKFHATMYKQNNAFLEAGIGSIEVSPNSKKILEGY